MKIKFDKEEVGIWLIAIFIVILLFPSLYSFFLK